jgi:hypothetical protein
LSKWYSRPQLRCRPNPPQCHTRNHPLAPQVSDVVPLGAEIVHFGHEPVIAAARMRLEGRCRNREIRGASDARHKRASAGIHGDAVAVILLAATQVGGVCQRGAGVVQFGDECVFVFHRKLAVARQPSPVDCHRWIRSGRPFSLESTAMPPHMRCSSGRNKSTTPASCPVGLSWSQRLHNYRRKPDKRPSLPENRTTMYNRLRRYCVPHLRRCCRCTHNRSLPDTSSRPGCCRRA